MSTTESVNAFLTRGCLPHQAEFAAKVLAPGSPRKHLLVSIPGLGKGFAAAMICNHAHATGQAKRILILTPSPLVAQWQDMVRRGNSNFSIQIIDRRDFRVMEAAASKSDTPWPATGIVLASIDFAKQVDIAESLSNAKWDLLVVDEAHRLSPGSQRYMLILGLVESAPNMRVLFLRAARVRDLEETRVESDPLFRDAIKTVWSREDIRGPDGKPLLPEVHIEWISYTRQPDEVGALSMLQQAVRRIQTSSPFMHLIGNLLLQAASSSLFALEQRLNRIRLQRNELVDGKGTLVESDDGLENILSDQATRSETDALIQSEFVDAATEVLQTLNEVETDSKLDTLLQLLKTLGSVTTKDCRICIFTQFGDTATYLESVLREHHPHVAKLAGNLSLLEQAQIVGQFAQTGGIIVATEAISMEIPEVTAAIFYDLPWNPVVLDARIGQFIRIGRHHPVRLFAFMDQSQGLIFEGLQKKLTEIKKALSEEELGMLLKGFSNSEIQGFLLSEQAAR
jgi:ERCC4-related helicase